MKNKFLLFLSVVFLGIGQIWGQTITEDFETQTALTSSYANDSFVGADGVIFTYVHSRDEGLGTSDSYPIDGKGIMLRRANEPSSIEFTLPNGVGNLSFEYRKAFTGSSDRVLAVLVNGVQEYLTPAFGGSSGADATVYTFNENIDEAGAVTIKITYPTGTSTGNRQITIDNISWTEPLSSCEASNITFANPTATADLADGTFTQTATSLNETTAITYESSDEAVATVNPSTGEVTLLGLGTTSITANQEAGTHNATDYCAGTATYELTVISTEPVLIVSTNSLSFTAFAGGASATEDITINGANLTGDIALSLTGDTNFSIDPNTLSASGGTVTVTYTPSASPATHSATLTVSNGSLSEVIALSGVTNEVPAGPCVSEDFENIPTNNAGSYLTRTWIGNDGIEWTVNDSRTDQTITGKAIGLRNSTLTTTSPVAGGVRTLSFDYKRTFGGNSTLKVFVNGTQYGGDISVTSETPANFSVDVNVEGDVTIELVNSGNRIAVDNLSWTCSDAAPADTHFRSQTNGDWTNAATWESSEDGLSWADAITYPGATAESVVIQAGHTVNINSSAVTITNTNAYGTLEVTTPDAYSVSGEQNGVELFIKDGGVFLVNSPGEFAVPVGNAFGLVETGGKIIAGPNMGSGTSFVDAYVGYWNGLFYFGDAAICEWANSTTTLGSSSPDDYDFFFPYEEDDMPIFRVTATPGSVFGNNSYDNIFYSVLEIIEPATFSVRLGSTASPQKTKTFVGGVRGSGKLIMESNSGPVIIGNSEVVPELDGTATIVTNITDDRLRFPNGANVTAGSVFTIENSENTQNIAFERQEDFNIHGTLDITNMRITNTAPGGVFVKDGGTLRTRHTGGLFGDSSAIVNATNFTMETGSTIDYYADVTQAISSGKEYYHLIFSGNGTKNPQNVTNVNTNGSILITGNPTVDYTTQNLGSPDGNSTDFTMDGGKLIIGTGGTQPNMRGTYNLSGGVIEFANSSASGQTIRSTNAYSYQNIEVTGNSVGTSGGNLVLNENGTFVVKPNGIFTINTNSIVGPEGNQTIEIEGNGTFRTGNADGFSGGDGTSNPGQTTSIRNNIENIILHPNSIVEYSRSGDQTITNGIVTTSNDAHYQNLRISGSGVKTTALGNLIVNEITYVDAATLRVSETNDDVAPNVLTARKGIQVVSGATALFENNANLMQDDGAINTGTIIVHRESKPMVRQDATGWSSPVSGQNVRNFSPGTLINRFYIYNGYNVGANGSHFKGIFEDTENYPMPQTIPAEWPHDGPINGNQFNPATYTFKPGWGYSIRVKNNHTSTEPGESVTGIFTGTPHNGSYTVPAYGKYTMVGNPYPSAIEIDEFFTENTDVDAIHVWTHVYPTSDSENYNSNYSTITRLGEGGNLVPGSSPMNGNIAIGQGFVVEDSSRPETTDTLWTINFNNGMRVADRGIFQRNIETTEKHRFWLNVYDITTDLSIAQVLLGYMTGATNDYDHQLDGRRMGSAPLYSLIDEEKYTVQARALPFSEEDIIPLGISPIVFGKYKIEIDRVDGLFDEGQEIYLKDNYLQTLHNLSLDGGYEFEAEVGEFHDRFEIVFKPEEVMETIESELNNLLVYHSGESLVIESKNERILSVELYDLNGKSVHRNEKVNAHIYQIHRMSLATQVLIVKVLTENGEIRSKKIINH